MIYKTALPHIDNINWLKQIARPFPTTAGLITLTAQEWNFSSETIDFLKLFPEDEVFKTDEDFQDRCHDLELMIREEQSMPAEILTSYQD